MPFIGDDDDDDNDDNNNNNNNNNNNTSWSKVFLEKLTGYQLVKIFSTFYEKEGFL